MSTESLANKRQSQRPNKPAPPIPGLSAPKPSAPPRPSTQPQFNDTATLSDGAFSEPQSPSQAEDEANLSSQNPQSSDADTSQSGSQVPDKRPPAPQSRPLPLAPVNQERSLPPTPVSAVNSELPVHVRANSAGSTGATTSIPPQKVASSPKLFTRPPPPSTEPPSVASARQGSPQQVARDSTSSTQHSASPASSIPSNLSSPNSSRPSSAELRPTYLPPLPGSQSSPVRARKASGDARPPPSNPKKATGEAGTAEQMIQIPLTRSGSGPSVPPIRAPLPLPPATDIAPLQIPSPHATGATDQISAAQQGSSSPNLPPKSPPPMPPSSQFTSPVAHVSNDSTVPTHPPQRVGSGSSITLSRPPPPPLTALPSQAAAVEPEQDSPLESPESADSGIDSNDATSAQVALNQSGADEIKAGRRLPSRPAALSKTTRTNNLPHSRTQSGSPSPDPGAKQTPPPIPKKSPRIKTGLFDTEPELSPEDFVWTSPRNNSSDATTAPTADKSQQQSKPIEEEPLREVDHVSSGSRSSQRSIAVQAASKRTISVATVDAGAHQGIFGTSGLSSSSSNPHLPGPHNTANPRDSAAIVQKLGIQTMAEETPDMMKTRGNLADEILRTEAVYLEDLRTIVSKFLMPLRINTKVISPTEAGKLFLNIESLELISQEVHDAMKLAFSQTSSSAHVSLAPIYLRFAQTMLQGFSLYCAGHSESLSLLTRLKKKSANFAAYLEQLEADEALNKLKLADMLTRPIQHICRQPLLLRELLKSTPQTHADYEDLIFALDQINDLVDRVNSNAKEVGNIQAITNVENLVTMLPEGLKLLMPGRYMLREGRFLRLSAQTGKAPSEHYLFLFSDMLILTKPKSFNDGEYVFTELLPLHQMHIEEVAETEEIKNAFSVTSLLTLRSHIFVAKDEKKNNEVIKRDWLAAISTTKVKFERGLAGLADDETSLGIAFKVQSGSSTGYENPYEAMRDQLSSVSVQQRITGWRGESVLKEIYNSRPASERKPEDSFVMPLIIKFHMEAPAAIKVISSDDVEHIENEGAVFVFESFLVLAMEKKDVQVKQPYDWMDKVIYASCVLANTDTAIQEKKIKSGRTVFPLTLISAATRKKFVLYFRSDTIKNNMYQTLSAKMPAFLDNGAAIGASVSAGSSSRNSSKDLLNADGSASGSGSAGSGADDSKGTLRTKKNIFGRKLGYRTVSQSTNASGTIDTSSNGSGASSNASQSHANGSSSSNLSHSSSSQQLNDAKRDRIHSQGVPTILATQGTPTPFLASSTSSGSLNSHNHAQNSGAHSAGGADADEHEEPEKLLTADGFEVPPWAPDDSSNVCLGCNAKFTATNRRHHCRNCGQLFCKKCTQKKCFLPRFGFTQKKMRVCEKCFLKH